MHFGVARDLITPDHRTHIGGYTAHYDHLFEDIHDDIYVKALVIDDGRMSVVLVTCDLLFQEFSFTQRVQQWAQESHGLPPESILISYSHSHSGPHLAGYGPDVWSRPYQEFLFERITTCITRALMNRIEGSLKLGVVPARWGVNRRRPVEGEFRLAPNYTAVRDEELYVLVASDSSGQPRVILLNWGCHPVNLRGTARVSAEFPGRACQLLEAQHYGATALFFQGAGGNIRPLATAYKDQFKDCSFEELDEMAHGIAAAASQSIHSNALQPLDPDLRAVQFSVNLPLDAWPRQRFLDIAAEHAGKRRGRDAQMVADSYDQTATTVPLPGALIRLAPDVAIAAMGGEPCYEVRQLVAQALPVGTVLFVGYLDAAAYIPTAKILGEGGYEPVHSVIEFRHKGPFSASIDTVIAEAYAKQWGKLV